MLSLTTILKLKNPVYWILPESKDRRGFPHETLTPGSLVSFKDQGCGVFFCPNELGSQKNAKGNLRHEHNVTRFTSVFVDLDTGTPPEQLERIMSYKYPASAVVRTGRGHHAYWVLDPAERVDPLRWKSVQKRLAKDLEGDPACNDPARLMRVPSTWHVKYEPKLVELIHSNEQWTYSLSDFPELEGTPTKVFHLPARDDPRRHHAPRPPRIETITEGERHGRIVKECARYLRGVAPSEIRERTDDLKAWYAQSSRPLKRNWEAEIEDVIEWVLKKELGNFNL